MWRRVICVALAAAPSAAFLPSPLFTASVPVRRAAAPSVQQEPACEHLVGGLQMVEQAGGEKANRRQFLGAVSAFTGKKDRGEGFSAKASCKSLVRVSARDRPCVTCLSVCVCAWPDNPAI